MASVRLDDLSTSSLRTLPTETPAIRTSASVASVAASGNATCTRYPCGLSGIGPPNDSHRNSSSPKHDSANTTIVTIRSSEGAALFIRTPPSR